MLFGMFYKESTKFKSITSLFCKDREGAEAREVWERRENGGK